MSTECLSESAGLIISSADRDILMRRVFDYASTLGFDHFAYALKIDIHLMRPHFLVVSGFPAGWVDRYLSQNYFECDPVLEHVMRSPLPLMWGKRFFDVRGANCLWEDADAHGLGYGISIGVREGGGFAGVFTLARDQALDLPRREVAEAVGHVQMLAASVHMAVTRLELEHAVPQAAVELTDRERECLLWAADGKTAWEIGRILRIAERTAVFHLNNCIAKLGAANKTQAIVRAMSLGLFESKARPPSSAPARGVRAQPPPPGRRVSMPSMSVDVHAL